MLLRAAIVILTLCAGCPSAAQSTPVSAILRNVARYSVRVRRDNAKSPASGSGSVISFNNEKIVITCAHVVGQEQGMLVDFDEEGSSIKTYPVLVDKIDEKLDLAILRFLGPVDLPGAPLAKNEPALYEELYVIGSPVTVMRQSSILRVNTKDVARAQGHPLWTVSGSIIPGMSGSGVFNASGEIVAVVESCLQLPISKTQLQILPTNGFVIPVADIRELLKGPKQK